MGRFILGISCFYHDSAAALIEDGKILTAVQEERFTRIKHDSSFPYKAIKYCLSSNNIDLSDLEYIVYYEKPLITFERLLETYLGTAPRGLRSFVSAMQVWLKEKLPIKSQLKKQFSSIQKDLKPGSDVKLPIFLFPEHHQSHAASAFYPSPYQKSAILCMDGVGEWATTSTWIGEGNHIKPLWEISFPHSLGLLYAAFTYYCGFKINSGEYKLMGLAPYGENKYTKKIKENLIDIKDDGTFNLDMSYFKYHRGFKMTTNKFHKLFGANPRKSESALTQFHMDIAASIQTVTEEIVIKMAKTIREETGLRNLCMSGGVALNCVANGKLLQEKIFDNIWIQPASGDAGSSLGGALLAYYEMFQKERKVNLNDSMRGSYLGCAYSNNEINNYLIKINASFRVLEDKELFEEISRSLDQGQVIGWFDGAMEFGPRALGARSIIGDPRNSKMQKIMNLKIKYRESFRPFAPSVLEEDCSKVFEIQEKSPYMLFVAPIKKNLQKKIKNEEAKLFGFEKLNITRSSLPAITHVDYSARIQTVNAVNNPRYYQLIKTFKEKTGCSAIVNTSFNVRGEPIVRTPQDAYRCFMRTEIDILVLKNHILIKEEQPQNGIDEDWDQEFELD